MPGGPTWTIAVASTHEREITDPVDLCTPDGRRLAPAAKGWSRTPLHTAGLRGSWGRNKRWDYWAVLAGDLVLAVTYADVDDLGMATVWWWGCRSAQWVDATRCAASGWVMALKVRSWDVDA